MTHRWARSFDKLAPSRVMNQDMWFGWAAFASYSRQPLVSLSGASPSRRDHESLSDLMLSSKATRCVMAVLDKRRESIRLESSVGRRLICPPTKLARHIAKLDLPTPRPLSSSSSSL